MKYSKGDKVRVKSIDWYNQMLSIPNKKVWQNKLSEDYVGIWCGSQIFYKDMCVFCDKVMTIRGIVEDSYYIMEEDNCGYKFTDDMLSDSIMPKFRKDDRVETHDGLFGYIEDIEYDGVRNCYQYYVSFIVDGGYYYEDQLKFHERKVVDSKVPKFKVGDKICKVGGLSNGYLVTSVSDEYYGLSLSLPDSNGVGVLPVAEQDEWVLLSEGGDKKERDYVKEIEDKCNREIVLNAEYNVLMETIRMEALKKGVSEHIECPDGYEFRDGKGNLIAVDKIVLAKKSVRYPSTPKECCEILNTEETYMGIGGYKGKLLEKFQRLLICQDAYWKIAGEEMGLGKSWEPDWKNLSTNHEFIVIKKGCFKYSSRLLVFPTAEMRDAFYEAFEDLIEKCKELL